MAEKNEILLCYRGRYRDQVKKLAELIRKVGLRVSYDCEILADADTFDPDTEVSWVNLGDAGNQGGAWRAPLWKAVDNSELVVFLVEPRDISVNVINEVCWTAEKGRYIFLVFDVPDSKISIETESLYLSFFQIMWMMATRKPDYPNCGYHVVAHASPDQLDARLEVLVNRIFAYLNDARAGLIGTSSADNNLTMDDVRNSPWEKARERLRAIQDKVFQVSGAPPAEASGDPYQEALELQRQWEQGASIENGRIRPPGSPFSYPYESETKRFQRTEQIISRVRPGPQENLDIFALLARQAATIEIFLAPVPQGNHLIFPGTVLATNMLLFADVVNGERFDLILLNASFVDFVYQITKVSVQSWKLTSGLEGPRASFQTGPEDVRETLKSRPELTEGFYRCLSEYVCDGLPGESTQGAPHPVYQAPLSVLDSCAERFMLAQGYAQVLLLDPRFALPPGLFPKARKDFLRDDWVTAPDRLAAWITMKTGAEMDLVDPMIALQGCLIALHCLEVIESAVDLLAPRLRDPYRASRPAPAQRHQALEGAFFSITLAQGVPEAEARQALEAAIQAARVPRLLWDQVRERFAREHQGVSQPSLVWH